MRTWVQRIRAISPWIAPVMGVAVAVGVSATLRAAGQQAPSPSPSGQDDQASQVLTQLRSALGGEKSAAIKSLAAEGSTRLTIGEREITMDLQLKFVLPDHFQRISQPELPNGMPGPRMAQTLNGTEGWAGPLDPMPNFGGGPGGGPGGGRGGMILMSPGGPGGPAGAAQTSRIRGDMLRLALGMFASPDALQGVTYTYAGTAQSKDGEADVLAVKAEGLDAKLFIDKKTHLPLMLTFMAPDISKVQRIVRGPNGPGGAPGASAAPADPNETPEAREKRIAEERQKRAEEMRKQFESLPLVENQLYYADYKKVDGALLPHRLTRAVNGTPTEETQISKYKVNPKIDLNDFQKKGS